jgi:hypothetical protein
MQIIAYGIVVKPPVCLLNDEETRGRVWRLAMVVDCDCDPHLAKPGYYQVMMTERYLRRIGDKLKTGTPILVRGRVSESDPLSLDGQWNHRIVTAESVDVIFGTLGNGRSFQLPVDLEAVSK